MPYYFYVLHAVHADAIYNGFTSDLSARIESHNALATKGWTIRFRPWKLVLSEIFDTKGAAMRREKELRARKTVHQNGNFTSKRLTQSVARWDHIHQLPDTGLSPDSWVFISKC